MPYIAISLHTFITLFIEILHYNKITYLFHKQSRICHYKMLEEAPNYRAPNDFYRNYDNLGSIEIIG